MTVFNTKKASAVLVGMSLVYLVASLVTGRSARADFPPDLTAETSELGIGVWQAADLMAREGENTRVVDARSAEEFERYHVPGSQNEPGADAKQIAALAKTAKVILIATKDEQAEKTVSAARKLASSKNIIFLTGGAQSWYLALALPIPLFSDKEAPFGYEKALEVVKTHFANPTAGDKKQVAEAIATLARLGYQPTLLKKSGKPKAGKKKRKKIAGGCG